ncbi:MAG: hypothetical protein P9L93_02435 [Candidatus Gorgyraea atricola]|nr:hypothetical protein [Candidatus Gorgyraea atricola]
MKKLLYLFLVPCFLSLIVLSGCTTMSGSSSYSSSGDTSLDVAAMLRLEDVPVPTGFKVLNAESFAFQNDVTRVALLKYTGSKTADQVVAFYKQQMPMYNWNPINIIEYERRMLNYEKSGESCIVTIEGKGRKSTLIIAISPKSRPMKVEIRDN